VPHQFSSGRGASEHGTDTEIRAASSQQLQAAVVQWQQHTVADMTKGAWGIPVVADEPAYCRKQKNQKDFRP